MSDFVSQEFERRKLSAWILEKLFRISIHFYITGVDNFEKVFSTKEAAKFSTRNICSSSNSTFPKHKLIWTNCPKIKDVAWNWKLIIIFVAVICRIRL